jgi:hypothetical protein
MPAKLISLIERRTVIALRRESVMYSQNKPGRIPPADSPNRPELARLWLAAYRHSCKRPVRTFTYYGHKFGVVYAGDALCVLDLCWRKLLVKQPTSMAALAAIVGNAGV